MMEEGRKEADKDGGEENSLNEGRRTERRKLGTERGVRRKYGQRKGDEVQGNKGKK